MKRALITGAAAGIGKALSERFAGAGYNVTGIDVADGDLADRGAVDALAARLATEQPFDLVVHNAGISHVGRFDGSDLEAQQRVLDVNLTAPMVLTARLLEANRVNEGGCLVFVSSLSHYVGYPGASVYAATKDGLASYARSLSTALKPKRIHVVRVFPGPTRTEHAKRYSPAGSKESSRMDPAVVARYVERAVRKHKKVVVPGFGNRLAARLGRVAPGTMGRLMKRVILDKL